MGVLKLNAPIRCTDPTKMERKLRKRVMSRPVSGTVKKCEATRERKRGESPNNAMLEPDAMPLKLGKFFAAANIAEKNLGEM